MWSGDGKSLYFMSDRSGAENIVAIEPGQPAARPITSFKDGRVLWPSITADGKTEVNGVLDTAPSAAFTIDLYASDACDPSGYGEGERYLGAAAVTTDGSGHASFSYTTTGAVPAGDVITATATTADGSTSEFSACRAVTTPPAPPAETPTSARPAAEQPAQPQPQSSQPAAPRPPTRLPAASLTAPRRLRVGQVRAIAVTFAPDSDGDYTVGGVIAVPGLKGKARALKARNGSITAGQKAKIKLIPPRALIASARKALRKRKSLTAELSVRLVAADGQVRTLRRTIQIVR